MRPDLADIAGEWRKNRHERLMVYLGEYNGTKTISARAFVQRDGENWAPTRKGLTLGVDQLPLLIEALTRAETEARIRGWVG